MIDEAVGDRIFHRIDIGSGFRTCRVDLDGDGEISTAEAKDEFGQLHQSSAQEVINYLKERVDLWNVGCRSIRTPLLQQSGVKLIQVYNAKEGRLGAPSINVEGISWRVTGWILWKFRIDSACEWKYTERVNPFREVNIEPPSNPSPGIWDYIFNGLWPPVRVRGPIPGLRLKAMRRGLQDYEYFWLVTSLKGGDRSFADNLVRSIVRGGLDDGRYMRPGDWAHHPQRYFEARRQVAAEILRIQAESLDKTQLSPVPSNSSYPNPFNPECYIPVGRMKDKGDRIKVKIYNILGQLVREIEYSRVQKFKAGVYWDGRDNTGCEVASGVYFYEIAGKGVRKMVVLR
jgi:hypothetical protein